MSNLKKFLSILFAMIIAINCLNFITVNAAGSTKKVGNAWYTITSEDGNTAEYKKPANKNLKTAAIPDTVKIGRKTYQITSIADNAFKNCKKITKVTIGKNVSMIGINAFYGCKNLKSIIIKSKTIADFSVGTKAFKGVNKKAVATVPSEKLVCYKSILKSRGFSGKVQKIKEKATENSQKEESSGNSLAGYINTSSSYFEKEIFNISTGDTATSGYSSGDTMPLYTEFRFTPKVYGRWEEDSRKLVNGYIKCGRCGKCFTDFMYAFHDEMEQSKVAMTGTDVDIILAAVNEYMMKLAERQIEIAFQTAQAEVDYLHQRTKEGVLKAQAEGKQVGRKEGTKAGKDFKESKKAIKAKAKILEHSKDFNGKLSDTDCIAIAGISRNTFYKLKKQLKEEI